MILFPMFCCMFWLGRGYWKAMPNALVRSGSVEILHVLLNHAVQLAFIDNQQVIETLAADTSQKAFTNRVCLGGTNRRSENLDAAGSPGERSTVLAVVVAYQEAWACVERRQKCRKSQRWMRAHFRLKPQRAA